MSAAQTFTNRDREAQAPAPNIALVSPSDSTDLGFVTRGLSFAVAGTLAVVTAGGQTVTIPSGALVAGAIHAIEVTRVLNTGTTATGIVAYW